MPRVAFVAVAIALGSLLISKSAQAAPISVANFSFESPALDDGTTTVQASAFVDWLKTGTAGTYNPQDAQFPNATDTGLTGGVLASPADGKQVAFINTGGGPGTVYQDVGPLLAKTMYTLTVAVGNRSDGVNGTGSIRLVNGVDPSGTSLGTPVLSNPSGGTFVNATFIVTTGAAVSGDLTIVLGATSGVQTIMDNVRLDATPVPEPSSIAAGLVAVVAPTLFGRRIGRARARSRPQA